MITTAKELYDFLEDTYGPSVRHIHVKRLPNGKKQPMGENSSYTREQIVANRGNPSSNCLSIYLKYTTGLAVLDFDQKEGLDQSGLWNLCVERDFLRCETNKGWHVYIQCQIPDGSREVGVGGPHLELDVLNNQRNVWEMKDRTFTGSVQELPWDELKQHLHLPTTALPRSQPTVREHLSPVISGSPAEIMEQLNTQQQLPVSIAEWLQHHFTNPAVVKTEQQTREKKRRSGDKVIVTQHHVTVTTIKDEKQKTALAA
eukprot:SAG25_NODE_164_length_13142_cov_11.645787_11_plen_258_part_00